MMKRNKNFIRIFFFAVTIVLFYSCSSDDKYFEIDYPAESAWTKPSEFEFAVAGAYNFTFSKATSAWASPFGLTRYITLGSSEAARKVNAYSSSYPSLDVNQRNFNSFLISASDAWKGNYRAINSVNNALNFINQEDFPFPLATTNEREYLEIMKGELYALRAYNYFTIVKRHAPDYNPNGDNSEKKIVLHLSTPKEIDGFNQPNIASVEEVYAQIVADLEQSINILTEDIAGLYPSYDGSHINKFGASALLAKVYFQMGNYSGAINLLNYVIDNNGGLYDMSESPFAAFGQSEPGKRGSESVWYMHGGFNGDNVNPKDFSLFTKNNYKAYYGGRGENWSRVGWHEFALSHDILKKVGWMDESLNETDLAKADSRYRYLYYRFEAYEEGLRDKILAETGSTLGYDTVYEVKSGVVVPNVWIDKYYRGTQSTQGLFCHIPVIRLGQLYLIRAACNFISENSSAALADLNIVRNRAGIGDFSGTLSLDEIYYEYVKECTGEGGEISFKQALEMPIMGGDRDVSPVPSPYSGFYWKSSQDEEDLNNGL